MGKINKEYNKFKNNNIIKDKEYIRKKQLLTSFFLDANYNSSYDIITLKRLRTIFEIKKQDNNILDEILLELENEKIICKLENNRYLNLKSAVVYECKYESKSRTYGFAMPNDSSISDIYIPIEYSKTAMNNDIVLVMIMNSKSSVQKTTGEVIKILKRNLKKVIGYYSKNANFGFVTPIDSKLNDIYISKKYGTNAVDGDIVEVEYLKYEANDRKAEAKILRVIGKSSDDNIEVKSLIESYGLNSKLNFSKAVLDEIETISDVVTNEDKIGRKDISELNCFTIDSADARDLDDAISIRKIGNNYSLIVSIADVSHYVKHGTALDKEAITRGTSTYIPSMVVPMLPKKLSNGICSLNEGVLRLALSVEMTISPKGEVLDSNIYKSIINVNKKMTYDKVYDVIMGINHDDYDMYTKEIFLMKELASILNKKRNEQGSINFNIPETKVKLDEFGNLIDILAYDNNIANNIIEEFMLITNMVVAERFFFLKAPFIYRIHEKPDEEKLRELNEIIGNYKKRLKGLKNIHPKAIADMLDSIEDEEVKAIISKLCLRTLKLAKYDPENLGHFGLAAKYYCHFTSPIRRYPDLFIHRVISEYLANEYNIGNKGYDKYKAQSEKYAKISSDMEKEATKIERDFIELYKALYMKPRVGQTYEGTISSVTSFGMYVKLDNTIEGLISFESMKDDYYIFDEKKYILIGRSKGKVYKIGDKINVLLKRVSVRLKQIDFEII